MLNRGTAGSSVALWHVQGSARLPVHRPRGGAWPGPSTLRWGRWAPRPLDHQTGAPARDGGLALPLCPQQAGQLQGGGGHTCPSVSRAAGASPPRGFLTITRSLPAASRVGSLRPPWEPQV